MTRPLRVVVLLPEDPTPLQLFAAEAWSAGAHAIRLATVAAATPPTVGWFVRRARERDRRTLAGLLDADRLAAWWTTTAAGRLVLPADADAARAALAAPAPAGVVSLAGPDAARACAPAARYGALWPDGASGDEGPILWGIVRDRPEWIGLAIHGVTPVGGQARILGWVAPQLAPGETGAVLLFRAWVEMVHVVPRLLETLADGGSPAVAASKEPPDRPATTPGAAAWLRYLAYGRGARARVLCARALAP